MLAVVRKGGDAIGMEVGQERHRHTFVDIDVPEGHGPTGTVSRTDGNLAALGNTCLGEEKPELFNASRHICIRKRVTLVVSECFLIPLLADGFLQRLQIVFYR